MANLQVDETFTRYVHRALRHLYEPAELQLSPLASFLSSEARVDTPGNLRKLLLDAIAALKPEPIVPADSNAWRIYQVLCYRFEEQSSQDEVAEQMAISARQVRRLEYVAIRALAHLLVNQTPVTGQSQDMLIAETEDERGLKTAHAEEFNWLKKSYQRESIVVSELVDSVLKTSDAMLRSSAGAIHTSIPSGLPPVSGQATTLRQALLNLLLAGVQACPGGRVSILADRQDDRVWIRITSYVEGSQEPCEDVSEYVELARKLVELSNGSLHLMPILSDQAFGAQLTIQAETQVKILVIDDNEDSLQLFERYLQGTRFSFSGTKDPQAAIQMAEDLGAQLIILDIMLPEIDGWEILGRLRSHPRLETMPVIISTILPHEQLAASLGASAFIRKPVNREDLLRTITHVLES